MISPSFPSVIFFLVILIAPVFLFKYVLYVYCFDCSSFEFLLFGKYSESSGNSNPGLLASDIFTVTSLLESRIICIFIYYAISSFLNL